MATNSRAEAAGLWEGRMAILGRTGANRLLKDQNVSTVGARIVYLMMIFIFGVCTLQIWGSMDYAYLWYSIASVYCNCTIEFRIGSSMIWPVKIFYMT